MQFVQLTYCNANPYTFSIPIMMWFSSAFRMVFVETMPQMDVFFCDVFLHMYCLRSFSKVCLVRLVTEIRRTSRSNIGNSRLLVCCWRLRHLLTSRWTSLCSSSRPKTVPKQRKPCRILWKTTSFPRPLRSQQVQSPAYPTLVRQQSCDAFATLCSSWWLMDNSTREMSGKTVLLLELIEIVWRLRIRSTTGLTVTLPIK